MADRGMLRVIAFADPQQDVAVEQTGIAGFHGWGRSSVVWTLPRPATLSRPMRFRSSIIPEGTTYTAYSRMPSHFAERSATAELHSDLKLTWMPMACFVPYRSLAVACFQRCFEID